VNGRVRFRFDWLGRDLALVRRGIEDHADAPRQPRPVPALRGDYRP
jgi:RAQPRD family integrative conjugative element protein